MTNKVVVLGSLNVDRILQMDRVPEPGETLALNNQDMAGGGKGANQAIAAARSGAQTSFIGRVGADENGKFMLQQLVNSGVTTDLVAVDEDAGTGQAFVMVEKSGENRILIYGGANAQLSATDVKKAQTQIAAADLKPF